MNRSCVAVIGDIVGSRQFKGAEREALQTRLRETMARLNDPKRTGVLATFVITTGDEFQGLLTDASVIPHLVWEVEEGLHPAQVRLGIGHGDLDTQLTSDAIAMDGPVWHAARQALEDAESRRRQGGVFRGFGELHDELLSGLAILLQALRDGFTDRQRQVVAGLRRGRTHEEIADRLGISRQAVTKHAAAAHWDPYEAGEAAWRRLLETYDYSSDWSER